MPKLSPRAIAHDALRGRTYLLAKHAKDWHLLALDPDAVTLTTVRTCKAPSETFWVTDDLAVFWSIGKTVVVPLGDPSAKASTIKAGVDHDAVFAPVPDALFAVSARAVHRFDRDRWTSVEGTAELPTSTVVLPTLQTTFIRALPDGDWRPLVEERVTRACAAAWAPARRCLVGAHGGTSVVIGFDGSDRVPLTLGTIWCAIGHERGFFAWSGYKIWDVGFDGTVVDTGITRDQEAADTCLYRTGDTVWFIQRETLHRCRGGEWTRHDMAAAGAAIGLA